MALAFPSHVVEHHLQQTQRQTDKYERVGRSEEVSRGEDEEEGVGVSGEKERLMASLIASYL